MSQQPDPHFKDIIVDETPKADKLQPNFYLEGASEIMPQSPQDQSAQISQLRKYSKIVKWSSVVLTLCTLFYLIPGAWPLVLTFAFPILGFISAHKFNDCLSKFYLIYLALILIVQLIVMGVLGNVAYIVLQSFVMLGELFIIFFEFKLIKELQKLDPKDRTQLNT